MAVTVCRALLDCYSHPWQSAADMPHMHVSRHVIRVLGIMLLTKVCHQRGSVRLPFCFTLLNFVQCSDVRGIHCFAGGEDLLSDSGDINALTDALPKEQIAQVLIEQSYAHLDFVWGMDAHTLIYPSVKRLLNKYSSGHNGYQAAASMS